MLTKDIDPRLLSLTGTGIRVDICILRTLQSAYTDLPDFIQKIQAFTCYARYVINEFVRSSNGRIKRKDCSNNEVRKNIMPENINKKRLVDSASTELHHIGSRYSNNASNIMAVYKSRPLGKSGLRGNHRIEAIHPAEAEALRWLNELGLGGHGHDYECFEESLLDLKSQCHCIAMTSDRGLI